MCQGRACDLLVSLSCNQCSERVDKPACKGRSLVELGDIEIIQATLHTLSGDTRLRVRRHATQLCRILVHNIFECPLSARACWQPAGSRKIVLACGVMYMQIEAISVEMEVSLQDQPIVQPGN